YATRPVSASMARTSEPSKSLLIKASREWLATPKRSGTEPVIPGLTHRRKRHHGGTRVAAEKSDPSWDPSRRRAHFQSEDRHMRLICAIVATLATLALAAGLFAAGDKKHTTHTTTADTSHFVELEKCIKACVDCAKECESCFNYCTEMLAKGEKMHATTVRTCIDCGEL